MKLYTLKTILTILLFSSAALISKAQVRQIIEAVTPQKPFDGTPILKKKSQVLQVGIGAPNNVANLLSLGSIGAAFSSSNGNKVGPFFVDYEYLIKENLGLGVGVSYAKAEKQYTDNAFFGGKDTINAKLSGLSFLLSTTYHFYITDKLDPYIKGSLGATIWKGSYTNQNGTEAQNGSLPTPIGYKALVGLRYFVNNNVAPFGEVSYSNLKFTAAAGIAFKLR